MKKKLSKVIILMLALMVMVSSNGLFVHAKNNDISNESVTSIEVTKGDVATDSVADWSEIVVKVLFDDKNVKIEQDDTISVSWTKGTNAYFNAYKINQALTLEGVVVGEVVVNELGSLLTFNDKIEGLRNVSGWISFSLSCRNTANTDERDEETLEIKSGTVTKHVEIVKLESTDIPTGQKEFYQKSGSIYSGSTHEISWYLAVNNNEAVINNTIVIKDQLQAGHKLLDSFAVEVRKRGEDTQYYSKESGMINLAKDYPGTSIVADIENNSFTVTLSKDLASEKTIVISYCSTITDFTLLNFENNTNIWYEIEGQPAVSGKPVNAVVANKAVDSGITGTTRGQFRVFKTLDNDENTPIPNVQFEIMRKDGADVLTGQTSVIITTDNNGIATITDLPVGLYQFREIAAPEWIEFNPLTASVVEFEIKETDTNGVDVEVTNSERLKTSVSVNKEWIGGALDSTTINLLGNGVVVDTIVLSEANNWSHIFEDVYKNQDGIAIDYTIEEVAIDGYDINIIGNQIDGFTVINTKITSESPEIEDSESETPKPENSESETPDPEVPESETPDPEVPEVETPKPNVPETETPNDVVSDNEVVVDNEKSDVVKSTSDTPQTGDNEIVVVYAILFTISIFVIATSFKNGNKEI